MAEVAYHVPEMVCGACESSIRSAIEPLDGVEQVSVDLSQKRVEVRFDEHRNDVLTIKQRIEQAGFDVA